MTTSNPSDAIPEYARYHNPPGWPEPTRRWVLEHQGSALPADWTPRPGVAPAPPGWVFWTLDGPSASELLGTSRTPLVAWMFVGVGIAVVGAIVTALTYLAAPVGGRFIVWWGAIVFGAIMAIRNAVKLARLKRETLDALGRALDAARDEALRAEFRELHEG